MRMFAPLALGVSLAGCTAVQAPVVIREPAPPIPAAAPPPPAAGLAQPARPYAALSSYIRATADADYPAAAVAGRQQGSTGVTLAVGPNGRVTGCAVTRSAGSSILDSATCRLLRSRARFHPARDESGEPRSGTFGAMIDWKLPAG